jgi:N-acetylglutamate synthase-like GNAT family acetyltransferase
VGTASAISKNDSLYIRGMAVTPNARGKDIGRLLLSYIENFAKANSVPRLFLSTTPFLDRAIRLYENFGFHRTDEGPHDLFGTPLFTMEKILDLATATSQPRSLRGGLPPANADKMSAL